MPAKPVLEFGPLIEAAPGHHHNSADTSFRAQATADLTLTGAYQDIPGVTVTLGKTGRWLVLGTVDFQNNGDDGVALDGVLNFGGTDQSGAAVHIGFGNPGDRATCSQTWLVTVTKPTTVAKLRAKKSAGAGTSKALVVHTSITAIWVGE